MKAVRKSADFKNKEVISLCDGSRLGFVSDVEIDFESGAIESIIVPDSGSFLSFIGGGANDHIIPWNNIEKVGDDIILVNYVPKNTKKR